MSRKHFWIAAAFCLLAGAALGQPSRSVTLDYRVFPSPRMMDGNWAALLAASDGKVYVGLAYHGGSGHLVFYDSKTDRVHDVGDINTLTGEANLRRVYCNTPLALSGATL